MNLKIEAQNALTRMYACHAQFHEIPLIRVDPVKFFVPLTVN
jgi:hypothetical protein